MSQSGSQPDYFQLACNITRAHKEILMSQPTAKQTTAHTPGPRCSECLSIHEVDTTLGTSFVGVGLCPLHAQAPAMREAVERFMVRYRTITPDPEIEALRTILRATEGA